MQWYTVVVRSMGRYLGVMRLTALSPADAVRYALDTVVKFGGLFPGCAIPGQFEGEVRR